ncbi:MAG: methyl-accepting chemotaxis protein [Gammaproteobacteria bacterium]|nr:methyl-accepting chemotaxis protein [Gammaproteobacteria bacterium]
MNTLAGKLKLLFIIFLSTFVLSSAFVVTKDHKAETVEHYLIEVTYPEAMLAHRLKFHTVQVQQWLTDISATRGLDGLNDGFDEAQNHANEFHKIIKEIKIVDPQLNAQLDELVNAFTPYYETGKKMAQAYVDEGPVAGNKMMTEFDEVASNINKKVEILLQQRIQQIDLDWNIYNDLKLQIFGAIGIAMCILIALATYFVINIRTILNAISEISAEFTLLGQGNFETRKRQIDQRSDELGSLGKNISTMKQQLRKMLGNIRNSANQLNSFVSSLSDITHQAMVSIEQQKSETEQVVAAITEMSANSREVAGNASMTAESASGADQAANNGKLVVQKTVSSIETLADKVNSAAESINRVEQDTDSIGSILEVIRGIAEQTNLLALNAAIEAARAGEQGRGFAVVADEVRTLASRTQNATGEIQARITQLQSGANQAVSVMNEGREQTTQSVDYVLSTRDSLNEITQAVTTISEMSTQIATAAEQQSAVVEEVSRNANNISDVNVNNAAAVQEIVHATQELSRLSGSLNTAVASFKFS